MRAMKKAESHLNISQVCQLMNVPIASYYYHPTDKPETAQYLDKIKVIQKESFQASLRKYRKNHTIIDQVSNGLVYPIS